MRHRTSEYLLEPISRARDGVTGFVRERPKRSLGMILLLGLLVAFGLWVLPEARRTLNIHRM